MPSWLGLYVAAFAFLCCAALVPFAMRIARRFGVMDHPSERKIHRAPIPLLGGLAILVAFLMTVWGHLIVGYLLRDHASVARLLPPVLCYWLDVLKVRAIPLAIVTLGGILVFLVGLIDDARGLRVRTRLIAEFVVSAAVVMLGVRPELPFLPDWLLWAVSIVWVVGITNSFNLIDGADGLAAGVATISSVFLGCVMWMGQQPMIAMFLFTLAGSVAGFLVYNRHPARIFMGSAGSMWIGYLLAVTVLTATRIHSPENALLPIMIPVLVLGIPLYDTTSVIVVRFLRGQPLTVGDKNHLHHRLMRIGFSHRQAVYFIYLLAFCVGVNSLLLVHMSLTGSLVITVQMVAIFGILVVAERVSMRIARVREEKERRSLGGAEIPTPMASGPIATAWSTLRDADRERPLPVVKPAVPARPGV